MFKKLTLLVMSVSALLSFVAPTAQAEGPLITNTLGGAAETVTAVSQNSLMWTALGVSECMTVNLHLDITSNANTAVHGHGTGALTGNPKTGAHTGPCLKRPETLTTISGFTINTIQLTKHTGVTTGVADITVSFQGFGSCTFNSSAVPVVKTGTDTINIKGTLLKIPPSGFGCLSNMVFEGDFTVSDEFGEPVDIH